MLVIGATLTTSQLPRNSLCSERTNQNQTKRVLTSSVSPSKVSSAWSLAQTPDSPPQASLNCWEDIAEPSSPEHRRLDHSHFSSTREEVHPQLCGGSRRFARKLVVRALRWWFRSKTSQSLYRDIVSVFAPWRWVCVILKLNVDELIYCSKSDVDVFWIAVVVEVDVF